MPIILAILLVGNKKTWMLLKYEFDYSKYQNERKKWVMKKVAILWSSFIDFCTFLLNFGSLKKYKK